MAPRSLVASDHLAFWHLDAVRGPSTPSFDHLVGAAEQRQRHVDGQRRCGLEADDELYLGCLLNRQVSNLLALEDAGCVKSGQSKHFGKLRAIAQKTAGGGELAILIDRRHGLAERQRGKLVVARV